MATLVSENFKKFELEIFRTVFGQVYEEYPPQYPQMVEVKSTKKGYIQDANMVGLGLIPEKTQGAAISEDTIETSWEHLIIIKTYAAAVNVPQELIDDEDFMEVLKIPEGQARAARATEETICANIYNNSFSTSYLQNPGDGKPLCSATHPSYAGTYTNIASTGAQPSVSVIETCYKTAKALKDERGEIPMPVMLKKILIPYTYKFATHIALHSAALPGTANNDMNPVGTVIPENYQVCDYFSSTTNWWIRTSVPNGPQLIVRKRPEAMRDGDKNTYANRYIILFRNAATWTNPRSVIGVGSA